MQLFDIKELRIKKLKSEIFEENQSVTTLEDKIKALKSWGKQSLENAWTYVHGAVLLDSFCSKIGF